MFISDFSVNRRGRATMRPPKRARGNDVTSVDQAEILDRLIKRVQELEERNERCRCQSDVGANGSEREGSEPPPPHSQPSQPNDSPEGSNQASFLRVESLPEALRPIQPFNADSSSNSFQSIEVFVASIEQAGTLGWSDAEKITLAIQNMKGEAFEVVQAWPPDRKTSWKVFKHHLLQELALSPSQRSALLARYKPEMSENENLIQFVKRISRQLNNYGQSGLMPETEKDNFIKGRLHHIVPEFRGLLYMTDKPLIEVVERIQLMLDDGKKDQFKRKNKMPPLTQQLQAAPVQHLPEETPTPTKDTTRRWAAEGSRRAPFPSQRGRRGNYRYPYRPSGRNVKRGYQGSPKEEGTQCHACGGWGHQQRDCATPARCYECHGVGHFARDCRSLVSRPSPSKNGRGHPSPPSHGAYGGGPSRSRGGGRR